MIEPDPDMIVKFQEVLQRHLDAFGATSVSRDFIRIYCQYRELAKFVTGGKYEDTWTHEQTMEFLNNEK